MTDRATSTPDTLSIDDTVDSGTTSTTDALQTLDSLDSHESAGSGDSVGSVGSVGDAQSEAETEAEGSGVEAEDTAGGDAAEGDEGAEGAEGAPRRGNRVRLLEKEGEVAADFLERLLDIADLDGDIEVDIDGDRAAVAIVDSEDGRVPRRLVGPTARCSTRYRS